MAKTKVSLMKKSAAKAQSRGSFAAVGDPVAEFIFFDNEDSTCEVFGVSKGGNQSDISQVATLAVVSADTSKVTVDAPIGMKFKMSAVGPVSTTPVNISVTATWNDGSLGPFVFDLPVTVQAGPANSIVVVPGTPVAR